VDSRHASRSPLFNEKGEILDSLRGCHGVSGSARSNVCWRFTGPLYLRFRFSCNVVLIHCLWFYIWFLLSVLRSLYLGHLLGLILNGYWLGCFNHLDWLDRSGSDAELQLLLGLGGPVELLVYGKVGLVKGNVGSCRIRISLDNGGCVNRYLQEGAELFLEDIYT